MFQTTWNPSFASSRSSPQMVTWNRHSPRWMWQVMPRHGLPPRHFLTLIRTPLGIPAGPRVIAHCFCGIMEPHKYMTLKARETRSSVRRMLSPLLSEHPVDQTWPSLSTTPKDTKLTAPLFFHDTKTFKMGDALPSKYKAAVYDQPGKISTKIVELDMPEPAAGDVLIKL